MVKPTHGVSGGPLLLAVAALVAASASIGLAARARGGPDEPTATNARAQVRSAQYADSNRTTKASYARVAGQAKTLAPAGDPSGEDVGSSTALCPSGTRVVSGGFQTVTGGGETFYSDALTGGRVGWAVGAVNNLSTPGTVQAFAYCIRSGRPPRAGAPPTAGASRRLARQRAAARREMKALVEKYRALRASQL